MATVGLYLNPQTQAQTPYQQQHQKERGRRAFLSRSDDASIDHTGYDELDTQFDHQQEQQQEYQPDYRFDHYAFHTPLPSIPSSEELPGLITHSQLRTLSESESYTDGEATSPRSSGWSTAPPSPAGGDETEVKVIQTEVDLKRNVDEARVLKEEAEGGWIAELDKKLDEVVLDPHSFETQFQYHSHRDDGFGGHRMDDPSQIPIHGHGQVQTGGRHRRQRSLSALHVRPWTSGHHASNQISTPPGAQSQSRSAGLSQPHHNVTQLHTPTYGQARTRTQSRNRARSIDRSALPLGLGIGNGQSGGSNARPFSPGMLRGRGRGRNAYATSLNIDSDAGVDAKGPSIEKGDKEKTQDAFHVSVKEVHTEPSLFSDRVVSSPSRRRRDSKNRDTHPHLTLYQHLHPTHTPSHSPSPASAGCLNQTPHKLDPYTATIPSIIRGLQTHTLSSVQIVEAYLTQINAHNPTLRALCWVRDRESVLREASQCDQFRARGIVDWERTPLWGVPIVVKDNIATNEELGMPTTAGSFALLGMPVKKDAFIVQKLRQAGAIILAKANMSELADYKSAHAGPGWSAVGGQTINVYAAHASPGTGSSGNGVAVAAGFCPASIGTETDGSITLPCLQSCLYGLKPTVGMLSRSGVVPFAPYFDTPGPMAKDVESLAILMDVMQGRDDEDDKTLEVDRIPRNVRYIDSCQNPTFEGLRIGIPRQNWHEIDPWQRPGRDLLVPELADPFEQVIQIMSGQGATVQDPANIPSAVDGSLWNCMNGSRSLVVAADCNEYLTKYLQNLGGEGGCRSVADIIAFNEEHADIEMPPGHHGQEVLKRCLSAAKVDSVEYAKAKAEMKLVAGKRGLDAIMDEYDLDALFMIREGHHSAANMVGYPIASVPIGLLSDNTPYGAFFIGRKHGEQTLLRIMAAWQATFSARPLPPIATNA